MNQINRCIFSGMQILLNQEWEKDKALVIEEGKIKAIIQADMVEHHLPSRHYVFPDDHYLAPGFIDLHIHGAHGKDVMDGDVAALRVISKALAAEGVTGFLATTMTASESRIKKALTAIVLAMADQKNAAILGVHLEGPFIAKHKSGAQAASDVQLPDIKLFEEWQTLAQGAIKLVTLAPELPNAIPFIQALSKADVITSVGHTIASYEITEEAIKAGCTQATHLFNAMRSIHQREPGPTVALLLTKKVMTELIVDGIHLHPAIVALCLELKGKEHIVLVTDAMRAKCLGDGHYELGGQQVAVRDGKAALADGTLAGSTLHMPQAIKNIQRFTQCSLADAILMASFNPARALKLDATKGSIAIGKDADLVVLNKESDVMLTLRAGEEIFKR